MSRGGTYLGKVCKACGSHERYSNTNRCVACHISTGRALVETQRDREREARAKTELERCAMLRVPSVWEWRGTLSVSPK